MNLIECMNVVYALNPIHEPLIIVITKLAGLFIL